MYPIIMKGNEDFINGFYGNKLSHQDAAVLIAIWILCDKDSFFPAKKKNFKILESIEIILFSMQILYK